VPEPFHYFRPQLTNLQALEAVSVAREPLVREIVDRLQRWEFGATRQHYLLIGPRGIGKTHVLRIIENRIRTSEELTAKWRLVCFPEEQYRVTSLADLLIETLRHLAESSGEDELSQEFSRLANEVDDTRAIDLCLDALRRFTKRHECGILLMVENLNRLLEKQIKRKEDIHHLRKILMEEESIVLLGTSPTYLNAVTEPEEPLFEFFRVEVLRELSPEDVEDLLQRRARLDGNEEFLEYLRKYRSRLRALYHFSGGSPRLTLMLYDLLAHQAITDLRIELEALLSQLTPFYQDRMKELGPQEAKILTTMALLPEGSQPTQLAEESRLSRAQVSTLLHRLENAGYVRRQARDGRKSFYTVPERFFRIWLQMSYSRQDRRRIQYLLDFFSTWYATPQERDEVWDRLVAEFEDEAANRNAGRVDDISTYMDYVAAVSQGDERFERHFEHLRLRASSADIEDVLQELNGLDTEFADDPEYFAYKGEFLARELELHEMALGAFEKALEFKHDEVELLFNRAVALDKLGMEKQAVSAYREVVELLSTQEERRGVENTTQFLLHILQETMNKQLAWIAAAILRRVGDDTAVSGFMHILEESEHAWRQRCCATTLGFMHASEAAPVLLRCLGDEASDVRGSAATALGRIGLAQAIPALVKSLSDDARDVRGSAATALGRIGSPEAIAALVKSLADEADNVRGSAATALGRIGAREAVPALVKLLTDEARDIRGSAAAALGNIGAPEAIPALVESLVSASSNIRGSTATALGKIGERSVVPGLVHCLMNDINANNRGRAAAALGHIGSSEGISALVKAVSDRSTVVRRSAAITLARIGTEEAILSLVDAIPEFVHGAAWGGVDNVTPASNALLRSAFSTGNLEIVRVLIEQLEIHLPQGEGILQPHKIALSYLSSGRDESIIKRQHLETAEAVRLLVSAFDENDRRPGA